MTEMKNNTLVSERAHREYFACRSRFQFLWSKINREYFLLLAVRIAVSYSVADIRSVACCLRYDSSKHPITHLAASIPFHVILLYVHIFTYSSHKHTHAHPFAAVCRVACVCERFLSSIHAQTNDSRIQLNVTVRSFCVSFTRFVRSFVRSVRSFGCLLCHSFNVYALSRTHPHTHSGNVYNLYNVQCLVARLFIQADTQPCAHSHTHTSIVTGVFEQFDETTNTNHDSCSLWTERIEIYIDILNMYICIHSAYQ